MNPASLGINESLNETEGEEGKIQTPHIKIPKNRN
jgi:hypothetical protein